MNAPEDELIEPPSHLWDSLPAPVAGVRAAAAGLLLAAAITVFSVAVSRWLPAHGVAILYLFAVVCGAVAFGLQTGLWAAVAAFLAYNYFFLHPLHSFSISDPGDLVSLVVFFGVAAGSGSLAGRLRDVAERARARSISLQRLNALAAQIAGASSFGDIASVLAREAANAVDGHAVVVKCAADDISIEAQSAVTDELSSADVQAAQRSATSKQIVYPASPGWGGSVYAFYPISVRGTAMALLGLRAPAASDNASDETLRAMAHTAAVAFERLAAEAETSSVQKEAEIERLRSALLSSVSHDLKTPLASIQGSVTSLRELGGRMPEETRSDLLLTIEEETARLLRSVTHLLDMTRLQAGAPDLMQDWIDLSDVASASVARARRLMPAASITFETAVASAIVRGNETLVEHVIVNVIENAVKFSDTKAIVSVNLADMPEAYVLSVTDDGAGIAVDVLPRIFDTFFRGPHAVAGGTGLGLAICKQVMNALGGRVTAQSPIRDGKGARISLEFPQRRASDERQAP